VVKLHFTEAVWSSEHTELFQSCEFSLIQCTFPLIPVNLCSSYTFASGSPDNIKQWKFPDGGFIQNLSGHNAIINTLAVNADGVLVSGGNTRFLWCVECALLLM
jgi:WD40 repeat protein